MFWGCRLPKTVKNRLHLGVISDIFADIEGSEFDLIAG